jgi:hypothetical protein
MSSVFLSAADHSGDRAALLGVSILICTCAGARTRYASMCLATATCCCGDERVAMLLCC